LFHCYIYIVSKILLFFKFFAKFNLAKKQKGVGKTGCFPVVEKQRAKRVSETEGFEERW